MPGNIFSAFGWSQSFFFRDHTGAWTMSSLGRTEALLPSSDCKWIEHKVAAFPPPRLNITCISRNLVPCLSISILYKKMPRHKPESWEVSDLTIWLIAEGLKKCVYKKRLFKMQWDTAYSRKKKTHDSNQDRSLAILHKKEQSLKPVSLSWDPKPTSAKRQLCVPVWGGSSYTSWVRAE